MKQKQTLLSISLLTSNRADTIRRCLDSLAPIREQLPCELILVNTSTDPAVREILQEYTDRIIPFTWCNDFSRARNAGLSAARGEWFLYLDDDEWFVETEELIDFFQSGEYQRYGYANYIQRNFYDPEYRNYTDSWVSRMIRLAPDTHFESRIHEYLHPAYGAGKNIHAVVNHSGYIYVKEEDRRRRFERNAVLLKEMMIEQPGTLRWRVQLAQEYYAVEEWQLLAELCMETLETDGMYSAAERESVFATFYAGAVEGLTGQKRYEEALEIVERAYADHRCSPLGNAYMHLAQGVIYFMLQEWEKSAACIGDYFQMEAEITAEEESYIRWQEALIADGAFDAISKKKALCIRIGSDLMLGRTKRLRECFSTLEWDQKAVYIFPPFLPVLFEALLRLPREPFFAEVWKCIWKNDKLYEMLLRELKGAWQDYSKEEQEDLLAKYEEWTLPFLGRYYREEMMEQHPEVLPQLAQRALALADALREEYGEEQGCLRKN